MRYIFAFPSAIGRCAGRCILLFLLTLVACSQATPTPADTVEPAPTSTQPAAAAPTMTAENTPTSPPAASDLDLPRFEPTECRFRDTTWPGLECGDLLVRENREVGDSPVIRLHVAIFRSTAAEPEPDPLIYLSGGPGSIALEWLRWQNDEYQEILAHRDVIFFDQRGIGYSEPDLDCPEVTEDHERILEQNLPAEQWIQGRVDAHLACQQRLIDEGIDLSAYNSAASAADVNDLRLALGFDQVNLHGVSYGTRLAQTVMRDYPQIVRSAILDSPLPIEENLLVSQGQTVQASMDLLFERCAADETCAAAYPNLAESLDQLLARLDQEPLELLVPHIITRRMTPVVVNGDLFMSGLFFSLYDPDELYQLPKVIFDTFQESPNYRQQLAWFMQVPQANPDFASEGQRYSVLCSEEVPFATQDEALAAYTTMHPRLRAFLEQDMRTEFAICDGWAIDQAAALENEPLISDTPALIFTGEFDPVTPPAYGHRIAVNLPNAQHVVFPYTSHGVFSDRRCARQLAAAFLDDPLSELDLACLDLLREQPPEFAVR